MSLTLEISQSYYNVDYSNIVDRVDFITVTDNPFGKPGISSIALSFIIKKRYGIRVIATINTRDRNRIGIISDILGALHLNVDGFFVVKGDNAKNVKNVGDISVFQLLSLIKKLGEEYHGETMIGATLNISREGELKIARKKMEHGANFFITQAVYDENILKKISWIGSLSIPVYIGFMPILSKRSLPFYSNVLSIPDQVKISLERSTDIIEENVKIFRKIYRETRDIVDGYHIMPLGNLKFMKRVIEVMKDE